MKYLSLLIALGALTLSCSSQKHVVNLEIDQIDRVVAHFVLDSTEGKFLNVVFETKRNDFDFIDKRVAFITGSSGKSEGSKNYYFDMQEKHSADSTYPCDNGTLYIFNAVQKAESGGYDAVIVYWSKFLFSNEDVVKRLKQHRKNKK